MFSNTLLSRPIGTHVLVGEGLVAGGNPAEGVVVHTGSFVDPSDDPAEGATRYAAAMRQAREGLLPVFDLHPKAGSCLDTCHVFAAAGVPFVLETPDSRTPDNVDIPLLKQLRARRLSAPEIRA